LKHVSILGLMQRHRRPFLVALSSFSENKCFPTGTIQPVDHPRAISTVAQKTSSYVYDSMREK